MKDGIQGADVEEQGRAESVLSSFNGMNYDTYALWEDNHASLFDRSFSVMKKI